MKYFLHKNAFVCETRRYWMVLNITSDEYVCIGRQSFDALRPWLHFEGTPASGTPEIPPKEVTNLAIALVRKGILTENARDARQSPDESIVSVTDAVVDKVTVSGFTLLVCLAPFFLASARADRCLKQSHLSQNVERVRERRRRMRAHDMPVDFDKARRLVAAFNSLRPLYPHKHICMFESLALIEFLACFDLFPSWVFAVSADPFQAHCWVQEGYLLLNDSIARTSSFAPIMQV